MGFVKGTAQRQDWYRALIAMALSHSVDTLYDGGGFF